MVGFASDSANVMVGKRNSVLSRVLQRQPKLFSLACVCHLVALAAAAGLKALSLSIDQLLIDIFYHFKHSSKRWQEFSDVLTDFEDIAPMCVLSTAGSAWNVLLKDSSLFGLLSMHFFDREAERGNKRVKRIAKFLGCVSAMDVQLCLYKAVHPFCVFFSEATEHCIPFQHDKD